MYKAFSYYFDLELVSVKISGAITKYICKYFSFQK